jgi:hypothetical protein
VIETDALTVVGAGVIGIAFRVLRINSTIAVGSRCGIELDLSRPPNIEEAVAGRSATGAG